VVAAGFLQRSEPAREPVDLEPAGQPVLEARARPQLLEEDDDADQLEELRRRVRALERSRETDHAEVMGQLRRLTARMNGQRGGRRPAEAEEEDDALPVVDDKQLSLADELTRQLAARQRGGSAAEANGAGRASAFPPEWFR
jgi:hypothetical protein